MKFLKGVCYSLLGRPLTTSMTFEPVLFTEDPRQVMHHLAGRPDAAIRTSFPFLYVVAPAERGVVGYFTMWDHVAIGANGRVPPAASR